MYDLVVFDCDGVLLNSNTIKTDAFRKALSNENSQLVEEFISYHKGHGGISRYKKIEYFYKEIKKEYTKQDVENALIKYATIVKEQLIICPVIDGVKEYLENLKDSGVRCIVNTGSDEVELKEVFEERGLVDFFEDIFGSPTNKYENMNRIRNFKTTKKILYYGDAKMDFDVAKQFKCDFVFVSGVSEWREGLDEIKKVDGKFIEDFSKLNLKEH